MAISSGDFKKMGGGDISLGFSLDINLTTKTETYQKRVGSWDNPKYQTKTRTVEEYKGNEGDLDECCWKIAEAMKGYMYNYAPLDESRYKDDIVLRENIKVEQLGTGKYSVGPQDIPYALRRNEENNKNKNKRHYIEKTWNFHISDYQKILDNYAEQIGTNQMTSIIQGLSGGKNINRGSGSKNLSSNGRFAFNTKLK